MKNLLRYSIIVILAFGLMAFPAFAQTTTKPTDSGVETTPEIMLSITAKKAKAEADLRALHTQLSLYTSRTGLALERLSVKKIDTSAAKNELILAQSSL